PVGSAIVERIIFAPFLAPFAYAIPVAALISILPSLRPATARIAIIIVVIALRQCQPAEQEHHRRCQRCHPRCSRHKCPPTGRLRSNFGRRPGSPLGPPSCCYPVMLGLMRGHREFAARCSRKSRVRFTQRSVTSCENFFPGVGCASPRLTTVALCFLLHFSASLWLGESIVGIRQVGVLGAGTMGMCIRDLFA